MWRAVSRGYVHMDDAKFVADGLLTGFDSGVERSRLHGHRYFKNYPSAVDARDQVTRAINKRVEARKTLDLGDWDSNAEIWLHQIFDDAFIFPMGAVPKGQFAPGEFRPTDDHTRTGLNAATDMSKLRYALKAHDELSWFLKLDHVMHVSDVDGAFPLLPYKVWLWAFMMFRFWRSADAKKQRLLMHIFGDFGSAGMPGSFYIVLVKVVIPMARSELILTLPMVIYVDDLALVGKPGRHAQVDAEMIAFQDFAEGKLGIYFVRVKDRLAAETNLYVGFVWDSKTLTRTLEENKLCHYIELLADTASRPVLELRERQSVAGKMQRAIMTLPPGAACLLYNMYYNMRGLRIKWHKRRTTRGERRDVQLVHDLLELNLGRGYYSYDLFTTLPAVFGDACKGSGYTGGGYASRQGPYRFWVYGTAAKRQPIDFLEGDTCLLTCEDLGHDWRGCIIDFGEDNQAWLGSGNKGTSKAERLNQLCRVHFAQQVRGGYIVRMFWLPSEENIEADHLSRGREADFLEAVLARSFLVEGAVLRRDPRCGEVRKLPDYSVDVVATALRALEEGNCANNLRDGPGGHRALQSDSVSYPRTTIWYGMPPGLVERVDNLMDNRLRPSSWRTVKTAKTHWLEVIDLYSWDPVISTDDPVRGAKMVAFVMYLADHTEITYSSITDYVWGLKKWQLLQHQADPVQGVMFWGDFMASVKVLTFVPHEPRKELPRELIERMLRGIDWDVFEEAQFGFLLLALYFTFARAETPCPRNFTGEESWDPAKHWQVKDILPRAYGTFWAMGIRFKGFKQDHLQERPAAAGEGDWSYVGNVKDSIFSIYDAYEKLMKFYPNGRDKDAPFFMARDRKRPYVYSALRSDLHTHLSRLEDVDPDLYAPHGIRVAGYNDSRRGNGIDATATHGRWSSEAHEAYFRFKPIEVVNISANMIGVPSSYGGSPQERQVERGLLPRGAPSGAAASSSAAPVGDDVLVSAPADVHDTSLRARLPEGVVATVRPGVSRPYKVYTHTDGHVSQSMAAAWRYAGRSVAEQAAASSTLISTPEVALGSPSDIVPYAERPSARPPPRDRARTFDKSPAPSWRKRAGRGGS